MNQQEIDTARAEAQRQYDETGDWIGFQAAMTNLGLKQVELDSAAAVETTQPAVNTTPDSPEPEQSFSNAAEELIKSEGLDRSLFVGMGDFITVTQAREVLAQQEEAEEAMSPEPDEAGPEDQDEDEWPSPFPNQTVTEPDPDELELPDEGV